MNQRHDMDRVVRALESAPRIAVPADFAARLMERLPEQKDRRRVSSDALPARGPFGRTVLIASLVVLLAGMALLAPESRHSALWLMLQSTLFLQFGLLLLWVAWSWRRT